MKKILMGAALMALSVLGKAQGLDSVIVEKYYISNAADRTGSIGFGSDTLPVGATTYRIFVDMPPQCKFQAAYGINAPNHALKLTTTTFFYNNTDRGHDVPSYSKTFAATHTTMIDSWFSVGAGCASNFGVMKTEDNGVANVVNAQGILANNVAAMGIPLTTQDGLLAGSPEAATFVGMTAEQAAFDGGPSISSINNNNCSWASLNGSHGPTSTNRVLIAQMTTDGVFHYELNLQIKDTITNTIYNYVAVNPVGGELTHASLSGTLGAPNILPTVSVTAPANNSNFYTGNLVNITATAADADGTISNVEFLVDNVVVGSDNSSPYAFAWTATVGNHVITARATDNNGGQTTSSPGINVSVTTNTPPSVSITSPANNANFLFPAVVTINANASDADGTVSQVEFFVDNVSVGVDISSPYSATWNSVIGNGHQFKAVATDNNGATTTSSIILVNIANPNALSYTIVSTTNTCAPTNFCVPVAAADTVGDIIGYDVVLHYNTSKVVPTGVITVDNDLVNPSYVDVINSIDAPNGNINISLFFNGSAPSNARFAGIGNVFCVEFSKTANFNNVDQAYFRIVSLQESYFTGVQAQLADSGSYITYRDSSFGGSLKFWSNNSAIKYNSSSPGQYLITNIYGNSSSCNSQSSSAVQPDLNGNFTYNTANGQYLNIEKNIASATNIQPVVNGFDAFLAKRVLINDASFHPSVYQLLSMDANLDGVISAGDVSQLSQRTVMINPEFKQAWNYDLSGNPIAGAGPSKDWEFIDLTTLNSNPAYQVSLTYPSDDGVGASKYRVPVISFCKALPNSSTDTSGNCQILITETYVGVLMGDVNGNFATVSPNSAFRPTETEKVIFDLSHSVSSDGFVDVPVSVLSLDKVNALDFSMSYNDKLSFNSIINHVENVEALANYNNEDKTLRFTSYSLQNYDLGKPVVSVRFNTTHDITAADLNGVEAYINGERAAAELQTNASDIVINVFPNPAKDILNVIVPQDATIQVLDVEGKVVMLQTATANTKLELNTKNFANGVYMLKVYNDNFVAMKKVVIQK
jgi:chitodextrinase